MASTADVLAALWSLVSSHRKSHNLVVRYRGHIAQHENGIEGFFHPDEFNAGPNGYQVRSINLYRTPAPHPPNEPALGGEYVLHDVCTLAHEYGHFLSWCDREKGTEWEEYFAAAKVRDARERPLSAGEVTLILAEEQRAWELGRKQLTDLRFEDWQEYDRRELVGLQNHRDRMPVSTEGK